LIKKVKETIYLIKYFLKKGNQVQLSTKKYIDYLDLLDINKYIKYYGQLSIFISSSTISNWRKYEDKTTKPEIRFKSFNIMKKLNIPVILYLKPILYNVTINDVPLYINLIKKYNIKDVVIGSLFTKDGHGIKAPFENENNLFATPINQEEIIKETLSKYANVYARSIEVLKTFKN